MRTTVLESITIAKDASVRWLKLVIELIAIALENIMAMMTETVMRAKLREHANLVKSGADQIERSDWIDNNPAPTVDRECKRCDRKLEPFQMSWSDVEKEFTAGRKIPDKIRVTSCNKCDEEDEGKEG